MPKLTIEQYLKGIDLSIEDLQRTKQWYLDYRFGSGMTPMLEEFAKLFDGAIHKLELCKTLAPNIEPRSLL